MAKRKEFCKHILLNIRSLVATPQHVQKVRTGTVAQQDSQDEYRNAQSQMKRHQPTTASMEGLRELEGLITRSAIDRKT
ncbi:hypothetical protein BDD12DRAFT_887169 [Trichophaea hybrida]|nr:hypothetical protein BDD12DRAFT_887169 [Trichophaea hybrida]